jgi:hypothetical protein
MVADIVGLDLAGTDLVVLSACDTGVGGMADPEGPASLRAAFLRAGARTVVASLWEVPDPTTRGLMTRFYALLAEGLGKGEALGRPSSSCTEPVLHRCRGAPLSATGTPGRCHLWHLPKDQAPPCLARYWRICSRL